MVDDEVGLKLRGSRVLEGKAEFQAISDGAYHKRDSVIA